MCYRYVWPWAIRNSICHDAYSCSNFPNTSPFPTERKLETNNYVGAISAYGDILNVICPTQCRPEKHPEWKLC